MSDKKSVKVKLTRNVFVKKKPLTKGKTVEVSTEDARDLIGSGAAVIPSKGEKPKKETAADPKSESKETADQK